MMFLHAMMNDINENILTIALYAATLAGLAWLRLMVSLNVSETFGPIISAMLKMVDDICQFLFLYVIQLMGFSIFAAMCFFQVKEFPGFYETVQLHF